MVNLLHLYETKPAHLKYFFNIIINMNYAKSTYNMLFLANLLLENKLSKKEILKKFSLLKNEISLATLNNYLKKLKDNNIALKKDGLNFYIDCSSYDFELTKDNIKALNEIKKAVIAEKNYKIIRMVMRFFYKISKFIKNEDLKYELMDFGYYSELNWDLIYKLESHCKNKDVILIDYILPYGTNKPEEIHTDKITPSTTSQRLYLEGIIKGGKTFSKLPIDRIYMIKKTIRKKLMFNVETDTLTYRILKNTWDNALIDLKEKVTDYNENYYEIETPITNEFFLIQRLFEFCPDLIYISEGKIKNSIIERLETLKTIYDNKNNRQKFSKNSL